MYLKHIFKIETFLIILFVSFIDNSVDCQFKPFHACQVRPCFEQSLLTCALRDQPWAALFYNGESIKK